MSTREQVHRHHKDVPHLARCLCGKVPAATKREAIRIRREMEAINGGCQPVRYYECPITGTWHWTTDVSGTSYGAQHHRRRKAS